MKVISLRIYLIGWNESNLNGRKSAQIILSKPKEPEWASMNLNEPKWAQTSINAPKWVESQNGLKWA